MNAGPSLPRVTQPTEAALVWIDQEHAVIVSGDADGSSNVACLEREPDESIHQFEGRTVDQVVDDKRVVVSGPVSARISFERAYVAVTHRPDRLIDIEPKRWAAQRRPSRGS